MKTIKIPDNLTRGGILEMLPQEGEQERQIRVSISSEEPYLRYDWMNDEHYWEVLDHQPGGMREDRIKGGMSVLFNHQRDNHLGRTCTYEVNGGKCTVTGMKWSDSTFAKEKRADVENGSLPDTSVGYTLLGEGEKVGMKDGHPILKFKWMPHEFSFVTIPADTTVGAGRELPEGTQLREFRISEKKEIDGSDKKNKRDDMSDTATPPVEPKIDVIAERKAAVTAFQARNKEISDWTKSLLDGPSKKDVRELANAYITGDKTERSFDDFRCEVLESAFGATAVESGDTRENATLGLSKKEIRSYSFAKAILEMSDGRGIAGLTGVEKESHTEMTKRFGAKHFNGIAVPFDVQNRSTEETYELNSAGFRALSNEVNHLKRTLQATTFTAGGALVPTELLPGSFIDILRNARLMGQGPYKLIEMNGLQGNITIPKQTGTTTAYWLPEGGTNTASQLALAQLALSPHRMGVRTSYTKQLLIQSSIGVEMLVRQDAALTMAVEEDRVIIQGSGVAGEPLGIINTSGVGAGVTFGGNATRGDFVNFEYLLENANVRFGPAAYLTTPLTKSYLRNTLMVSASTFPIYIWDDEKTVPDIGGAVGGTILGQVAYATKNAPASNVVIYGVWNNNAMLARWGALDLVVNPYTGDAQETIYLTWNEWMDFGVRYPQAYQVSTDAPTSP